MNKAILMGRLTRDPELKYTTNANTAVCTFSLAVNRKFAKEGDPQQADFINITAWRHTAEFCAKWFKKGQQVLIEGRIQTRSWDDNDGKKRYATDVVADEVYFADSKRDSAQGGYDTYQPAFQGSAPKDEGGAGGQGSSDDGFFPIDDDQLPF